MGTTSWLTGDSEIAELIRHKDWSQTPLGPLESWPEALRTTVSLTLASSFPINLIWGDGAVQIWNAAYAVVCGEKHPAEFGSDYRVSWRSAWPAIGEAFETARAGQTAYLEDQPMFLDRNGYLEETWFTFSVSPIRDERGEVAGLFHPVTETTGNNLAMRRTRTLRDLTDRMSQAQSLEECLDAAVSVLEESSLDLPFAALYLGPDADSLTLHAASGLVDGASVPSSLVGGSASPVVRAATTQRRLELDDVEGTVGTLVTGAHGDQLERLVVSPVRPAGVNDLQVVLVLGMSTRLPYDEASRAHLDLVTQVISSGLSGAIAYEREVRRAEELAALDLAKTTFFSNVSHEFRTPLTLMLGPLEEELARESGADRERLETVHRNSLRLLRLVNSLLDFSRADAGRTDAVFEPTDLAASTADLAGQFRSAVELAGLRLDVSVAELPAPVWVDPVLWERIVTNLLSNAFKHTFSGALSVTVEPDGGGGAVVRVSDTGVGIPATELPRLFDRFHRVQGARSRSIEGTGIGLALVSELVALHGGSVDVDSTEDVGTTMTVRLRGGSDHLPADRVVHQARGGEVGGFAAEQAREAITWLGRDADGADTMPAGPGRALPVAGEPRERIVLADDNADMRRHVVRLLSERFDVEAHPDGAAALEAALEAPPSLVLTDVMMPNLDGFGLLSGLRADPRTATVPVIMLSARAGEDSALEGIESGADDYLVKPFSGRELVARVSGTLALSRLRRETEERLQAANAALNEVAEAKSRFLANMSHELRTPMNAVIGLTSLLIDSDLDTEQLEFATVIRNSGEQLLAVINDILDFSRLESEMLVLERTRFSLRGAVEAAVDIVAGLATSKGLELTCFVPPSVPDAVVGDAARVRQVLLNLLGNAIKFTEAGDVELRVAAEPSDGPDPGWRVSFAVRDTGVGISADDQARLFDAFVQADSSRTRSVEGSGLGLAISRALTRLMDGDIVVWSAPGRGSTFTAEVRLGAVAWSGEGSRSPGGELVPDLVGARVLVVDDNATARRIAAEYVRSWRMEPVAVASAGAALALLRSGERFDLGLLDFVLPVSDGASLAEALRATPAGRDLPLVVLSSSGGARSALDVVHLPDVPVHRKPLHVSELYESVVEVLGRASAPRRAEPPQRERLDATLGERRPLSILAVDDNAVNQQVLKVMLARHGYEAVMVASGPEALAASAQDGFDLVLLDVQMPGMDGFEVTRRLRSTHPGSATRVVGVSAHAAHEIRAEGLAAGMDDYVTKPMTVDALVAVLTETADLLGR